MVEFLKAKQTQYINKPIGVIGTNTGASDVGQALMNAGNMISEIAFRDAVEKQTEAGKDYAKGATLTARDENNKLTYVKLPDDLSVVAKKAAKPVLEKRFMNMLERDTSLKFSDYHRQHKDDPDKFKSKVKDYILETSKRLNESGYSDLSGVYADQALTLSVQHTNKIQNDIYNEQENAANQLDLEVATRQMQESFEIAKAGDIVASDAIDQVSKTILNDLRDRKVIKQPAYDEAMNVMKSNRLRALLGQKINLMDGNPQALNALARSFKQNITTQDKPILAQYGINQEYLNGLKSGAKAPVIDKVSSWLATTKGQYASNSSSDKALLRVQNAGNTFINGNATDTSATYGNDLDTFFGQNFGYGREMRPFDIISMPSNTLNDFMTTVVPNAVVPSSVKNLINNPSIMLTGVKNAMDQNNSALAKKIIDNTLAVASVVHGKDKISEKQINKLNLLKNKLSYTENPVEAMEKVYRSKETSLAMAEDRKTKIFELDSSAKNDQNFTEESWIKKRLRDTFDYLNTFQINKLTSQYKDLLESGADSLDEIEDVIEKNVEKVFVEHPFNINLFDNKTGGHARGSLAGYYKNEDTLESVEVFSQNIINDTLGSDNKLGDNVFLMADINNGNTGFGRWTVVNADKEPMRDDFGASITITTDQIADYFQELNENKAKEELAEVTLDGKFDSWWQKIGFNLVEFFAPMKKDQQEMVVDLESAPAQSNIDIVEPPTNVKPDSVVAIEKAYTGAVESVTGFISETMDKAYNNDRIIRETINKNINSFVDKLATEGSEILRTHPAFIELSSIFNKDTLDLIMDSVIVKRPIDSHVFAVKTLIEDEDFSATQYPDGAGNSVGYGFFISSLEPDELAMIGDINNVTKAEATAVLNVKVKKIHDKFVNEVPGFETFSARRQAGFINFAYQLGYENVTAKGPDPNKNWPKFFNAMKRAAQEPWNSDSRQMVLNEVHKNMFYNFSADGKSRSKTFWFNQTPRRAIKVGEMIRGY